MKKIILPLVICLATLQFKARSFSNKDTITVKTEDTLSKKLKDIENVGPLMVTSLSAFTDSMYSNIPDSMPFYDWITDDIHQKKFNFGNIKDTIQIVLNDSNDHYTPPVEGRITSEFGKRRWRYHYGTDIDLNTGYYIQVRTTAFTDDANNNYEGIFVATSLKSDFRLKD